ncbi:hypothetical protein HPP92_019083 [Vanilla planifolia]|uniref:HTH myb-type domain-containing protein n=1 Tax=Vanilla planifolia TaxID=51239 RepID=A0A835UJ03_VANPL|nr:hypothetical protein HPP92_019083 [Vanilla planifolia]
MDSLSAKLGLDLKVLTRKFASGFLMDKVPAGGGNHLAELEDFVDRLQEERRKVDAFKSELPLCMILLTHVIDVLKLEMEKYRSTYVVEELISLKTGSIEDDEKMVRVAKLEDNNDKMEWLRSAQLWHNCSDESVIFKKDSHLEEKRDTGSDLSKESRSRSPVGSTFFPGRMKEEGNLGFSLPDLFLVHPAIRATAASASSEDVPVGGKVSKAVASTPATAASSSGSGIQLPRKARRCWSPELHRRFTIALQKLGGAQAATPKQIREVMKVDGLTNDEVKSHLQIAYEKSAQLFTKPISDEKSKTSLEYFREIRHKVSTVPTKRNAFEPDRTKTLTAVEGGEAKGGEAYGNELSSRGIDLGRHDRGGKRIRASRN